MPCTVSKALFSVFVTRLKRNAHCWAFTKFTPRNDGDPPLAESHFLSIRLPPETLHPTIKGWGLGAELGWLGKLG